MKLISFSLFDNKHDWQFLFYIRGLYFNVLMAKLVYPEWTVQVAIERSVYIKYIDLIQYLSANYGMLATVKDEEPLCKMMLWRMEPLFDALVERVICRDADALVTYREAQAVFEWDRSALAVHSIHDNNAHSVPLLGGLCGFVGKPIAEKYGSHKTMIGRSPVHISQHGSDQQFLTQVVYMDFQNSMMLHNFKGTKHNCADAMNDVRQDLKPIGVDQRLWASNLCISFIGTAGVNEMETLRFFRDNLPVWGSDAEMWAKYPKIFYWQ